MTHLEYLQKKEYKNMTDQERIDYGRYKIDVITKYMGIPVQSLKSLQLRTKAWLEETRTGFWD